MFVIRVDGDEGSRFLSNAGNHHITKTVILTVTAIRFSHLTDCCVHHHAVDVTAPKHDYHYKIDQGACGSVVG
jgi:hypothetical protein